MALRSRNASPWGPSARAPDVGQGPHLCRGVPAGSLCATEPRAREKTRGRKRKKCRSFRKPHVHVVTQDAPSGCVRRETPGVTQVDGKGHAGNTAVATAYLCWVKHGHRSSRTGVPMLTTIIVNMLSPFVIYL